MKKLRRVTEAEVVAEFLKNEFYQEEFHHDRRHFERLVLDPDISNEAENAVRRALLFRRRGHMWRELPPDTHWWEVQIEPEDLPHLRVFPRAQWRKISKGSFLLSDIVDRIKHQNFSGQVRDFIAKVHLLSYRLRVEHDASSVILIGVDDRHPMTILEGNHRLTAACLASPQLWQNHFRVLAGFSPRMVESCWYQTNLSNLWRYAKHRLQSLYDREADMERALAASAPPASTQGYAEVQNRAPGAAETVR